MGVVGRATFSMNPHSFDGYITETPPHIAIIRHYECIPYSRWLRKMKRYAKANVVSNYPFVNESVELLKSKPDKQVLKKFWTERVVYNNYES